MSDHAAIRQAFLTLMDQLAKGNFRDDHGHKLEMYQAYIEAQKVLGVSSPSAPRPSTP
jgi:hypothetical protein